MPIFTPIPVAMGELYTDEGEEAVRPNTPELRNKTKTWYIGTYGQEHYERYWCAVKKLERVRIVDLEKYIDIQSHYAYHDAESFVWIIINELLRAWPEGHEEKLTSPAVSAINILDSYRISRDAGSRTSFHNVGVDGWENIFHPRLAHFAPMVPKLVRYFLKVDWLLWPELPKDHGQEVVKVLVWEAIEGMKDDPIPLNQEQRMRRKVDRQECYCHKYSSLTPNVSVTRASYDE